MTKRVLVLALTLTLLWIQPSASGNMSAEAVSLMDELSAKLEQFELEQKTASSEELSQLRDEIEAIQERIRVIYGPDDRLNYYQANEHEKHASDATALVVSRYALSQSGPNYKLPTNTANLCPDEKFSNEPAPGFCSSFKVGNNKIATAGHCVSTQLECDQTSFVFRFRMDSSASDPTKSIPASNVYHCRRVVGFEAGTSDWAVLEVDREINAPLVKIRGTSEPPVPVNTEITVVGFPIGLPVKIANNAVVRSVHREYFVANLDTYGGNSGSAVFNSNALSRGDLLAEGILVRGEADYVQTVPCKISKKCPNNGCRGEDVTLAREIEAVL